MEDRTEPDGATESAEETEATSGHGADRVATNEEEAAADEAYSNDDPEERKKVAAHEKEMMELGATIKGEGEIK